MKRNDSENVIHDVCAPRIELTGNSRCVIEGIKSICKYNEEEIKIDLGKYCVTFFGDGLYIDAFTYEGAVIEGTIISMEFEGYV